MKDSALSIAPEIADLVADLTTHQTERSLTDAEMAEILGLPRSTWTAARNGRFRPGLPFVQRIALVPEFRDRAARILLPPTADSAGDTGATAGQAGGTAGASTVADATATDTPLAQDPPVAGVLRGQVVDGGATE